MGRPIASSRLDPATKLAAHRAASRAARITGTIDRTEQRMRDRLADLEARRAEAWREATDLGMSRTEAAGVAGLHHSAVDRALNGG